jgi:thermitase
MIMNFNRFSLLLAAVLVSASASGQRLEYAPGEILVRFKPGFSPQVAHAQIGSAVESEIPQIRVHEVQLPNGWSVQRGLRFYRGLASVEYAEPNYIRRKFATTNDPMLSQQYAMRTMGALSAFDLTQGSNAVSIAILDTGVDYNHPDLSPKVDRGLNAIDGSFDPRDVDGHGTHCAGIAAARTNNGVGIAGVGYNCRILAVKVLADEGFGELAWIVNGIVWAAQQRADVISLSLGSYGFSQAERDAVRFAHNAGSVVVAAAGNDNISLRSYPAAYDEVIAVGSIDETNSKSWFSNFGDWVDVAAPGSAILSTVPRNVSQSGYAFFDGTSMACPQVAGLAGLIISRAGKGNITNTRVREIIETTAIDMAPGFVFHGRVNALAAVEAAAPPIVTQYRPLSFAALSGFSSAGILNDVVSADASNFRITSRITPNGNVAEAVGTFDVDTNRTTLTRISLRVRSSARTGASLVVWLRNQTTGAWEMAGTTGLNSTLNTVTLRAPAPITQYLHSSGRLDVRLRSVVPIRIATAPYTYRIDMVGVETTNRTSSL